MNKKVFPSELRFDTASEDWVVIATGRAKKPGSIKKEQKKRKRTPKKGCYFCNLNTQEAPTLVFAQGKEIEAEKGNIPSNWTTASIFNKYPAFVPMKEIKEQKEGKVYRKMPAAGYHEVVITKDHDKPMGLLPLEHVEEVIELYYRRYIDLMKKPLVKYIAIFQNHGPSAGASIYHPHSQIITTPLIDTDLKTALSNSKRYYKEHKKCVYCEMAKYEQKVGERIVFANKDFLVLCPFASKAAFQMIITPIKHSSSFAEISKKERASLAEAFKEALSKLYKGLGDPDYNFYLHSAPCGRSKYPYHHWHWTIIPKTATMAGFELGVEMEISVVEPEKAADYLRKQ